MACEETRGKGSARAYDTVVGCRSKADRIPVGEVVAGEGPGARGVEVAWPRTACMSEYALDEGDGCEFVEGGGWDTR